MMTNNPYNAYKQQSVMTMTPGDMLTTVYDGLIKTLTYAKIAFKEKDFGEINRSLQKAQVILRHLQSTLDFQYDIANELNALYDYFIRTTIQINVKKDPTQLDGLIEMIGELRDAYTQADRKSRSAAVVG